MTAAPPLASEARRFLDGIWAAVPTPFRPDGSLDPAGAASNVRHYRDALGLTGVFCNGLIGEGWSLSLDERKRVLEAITAAANGALRVGVVTTHHSLGETVELSRHAAGSGADHIVLGRPPGPFTQEDLYGYVSLVAEAAACPVVLFDTAAQSGGFAPDTIVRLANAGIIAGVKCARGAEDAADLMHLCPDRIVVSDPYESNWLAHLLRFDLRTLYADPEPYLFQARDSRPIGDYFAAFCRRDLNSAQAIYTSLEPLRRVYGKWIMGPLRRGLAPNAALKYWCEAIGLAAGPVRAPLAQLAADQRAALAADLAAAAPALFGSRPSRF